MTAPILRQRQSPSIYTTPPNARDNCPPLLENEMSNHIERLQRQIKLHGEDDEFTRDIQRCIDELQSLRRGVIVDGVSTSVDKRPNAREIGDE